MVPSNNYALTHAKEMRGSYFPPPSFFAESQNCAACSWPVFWYTGKQAASLKRSEWDFLSRRTAIFEVPDDPVRHSQEPLRLLP